MIYLLTIAFVIFIDIDLLATSKYLMYIPNMTSKYPLVYLHLTSAHLYCEYDASIDVKLLISEPSLGSDENLKDDPYLIGVMDDQGWVPISTVAGFKRVCLKHILHPNSLIILQLYDIFW